MSKRYPGGYIFRSNPTIVGPTNGEGGSAPGVWTLEQASYYTKLGTWPQRVIPRNIYLAGHNAFGELGQNDRVYRSSDRKSTRLNSSHIPLSRMPSSA